MRTALLILFLVLPVIGYDGCREWEFKCGDKCVINTRTCKCGDGQFKKDDFKWCCHNKTCRGGATSAAIMDVVCPEGTVESLDKPCLEGVNKRRCPEDAGITRGEALTSQCKGDKNTAGATENMGTTIVIIVTAVSGGVIIVVFLVVVCACWKRRSHRDAKPAVDLNPVYGVNQGEEYDYITVTDNNMYYGDNSRDSHTIATDLNPYYEG